MLNSFRTPELDTLEEQIIEYNNRLMNEGNNAFYSFVDEQSDVVIHDPYYETSGRFSVDPYKEYGEAYKTWYLNLRDNIPNNNIYNKMILDA